MFRRAADLLQCESSNWVNRLRCKNWTRVRCPYCFHVMCGTHKHNHAGNGTKIMCDYGYNYLRMREQTPS